MSAEHTVGLGELVLLSLYLGSVVYATTTLALALYLFRFMRDGRARSVATRVAVLAGSQALASVVALFAWAAWPFPFDIMLVGFFHLPTVAGELVAVPIALLVARRPSGAPRAAGSE